MFSRTIAVALLLVGCVDTSPNRVKLTTKLDNVSFSVQKGPLVTVLSGSFDWVLDVGDLTSGDDTVDTAPSFQLAGGTGQPAVVLDALPSVTFPLTLKSGDSSTVTFTLTDKNTLAQTDAVCPGPVQLDGSFRDSLSGDRATPVDSASVTVSGCR